MFATALVAGLLVAGGRPAAAIDNSPIAAAQARQAQLAQVQAQLGEAIAGGLTAQQQLSDSLRDNRMHQDRLRGERQETDQRMAQVAVAEERTQKRIDVQRQTLNRFARALYQQPDAGLVAVFSAHDLGDFLTRLADLEATTRRVKQARDDLERSQRQLQAEHLEQQRLRVKQDGQLAELQRLSRQQEATLAQLQSKQREMFAELASVRYQSAATAQFITDALQAQQSEAAAAAGDQVWEQVRLLGGDSLPGSGDLKLSHPLPGSRLTQGFGPSNYLFEPPYGGYAHFHTGMDFSAPAGSSILSAADGTVVLTGFNSGGYGYFVVVGHPGGYATMYAHLQAIWVHRGQDVGRGQAVGAEGSTGNSTGAHLHFELRRSGQALDPAPYL